MILTTHKNLREQAKSLLNNQRVIRSTGQLSKLIEELTLYQLELEIQNEAVIPAIMCEMCIFLINTNTNTVGTKIFQSICICCNMSIVPKITPNQINT